MKKSPVTKIMEFLKESNAIEGEYSKEALDDALQAWLMVSIVNEQISPALIQGIHRRLMKRLNPRIAGQFRKVQVGVMTKGGFKEAIPHEKIIEELKKLCAVHPKTWREIKRWHINFEHIHPFEDGNGRTGRIIMNYQRLRAGLKIRVIHEGEEQQKYYKWFAKCKVRGCNNSSYGSSGHSGRRGGHGFCYKHYIYYYLVKKGKLKGRDKNEMEGLSK